MVSIFAFILLIKLEDIENKKKPTTLKELFYFSLPGVGRVLITGQHFTMEINGVVVVEEPKRSDLKLLETSSRIVTVIQRSISWATVGKMFS